MDVEIANDGELTGLSSAFDLPFTDLAGKSYIDDIYCIYTPIQVHVDRHITMKMNYQDYITMYITMNTYTFV